MIDPRALQQHFKRVHEKQKPQKPSFSVARVPEPVSLTAIQPVSIPEPIQPKVDTSELQKELLEVTQALTTLKQCLTQTPQIEPVTITVPVSVVTEIKQENIKTETASIQQPKNEPQEEETPYGYTNPKTDRELEEYNPYGYYSGPKF